MVNEKQVWAKILLAHLERRKRLAPHTLVADSVNQAVSRQTVDALQSVWGGLPE
jgi:hypothetical protein